MAHLAPTVQEEEGGGAPVIPRWDQESPAGPDVDMIDLACLGAAFTSARASTCPS